MAKVLLVDDDADVRDSLSDWLMREHEVRRAASVPEAMELIALEEPDAIIVDFECRRIAATTSWRWSPSGIRIAGASC